MKNRLTNIWKGNEVGRRKKINETLDEDQFDYNIIKTTVAAAQEEMAKIQLAPHDYSKEKNTGFVTGTFG